MSKNKKLSLANLKKTKKSKSKKKNTTANGYPSIKNTGRDFNHIFKWDQDNRKTGASHSPIDISNESFLNTVDHDSFIELDQYNNVEADEHDIIDTEDSTFPSLLDEHNYLWVYEPSDLDELSIEEIKLVWESRLELCGSIEVAAEALAILEVDSGITESYQGWQKYIDHKNLFELKAHLSTPDSPTTLAPITSNNSTYENTQGQASVKTYTAEEIKSLPIELVKNIWEDRESSLSLISAACTALARLRSHSGIDNPAKHWKAFINHEEILKLHNLIDDEQINRKRHAKHTCHLTSKLTFHGNRAVRVSSSSRSLNTLRI